MKSKKLLLKVFLVIISIAALAAITSSAVIYSQMKKIISVPIEKNKVDLGISPALLKELISLNKNYVNIALFGLDRRPDSKYVNADAIIILSINETTKQIRLASIMRDTYVKIEGKGMDKINSAYNLGGPQLAIKTLNKNFNLNITDYVSVDVIGLTKVIDALGGISLDIKPEEVSWVNDYMGEAASHDSIPQMPPNLTEPGVQLLNGMQAVAYTRIRYTLGNDVERTSRQRIVLTALINKIKEQGPMQFPYIVSKILPYVETSYPMPTLFSMGADLFMKNIKTVKQETFPSEAAGKGKFIDGVWYLVTDLKATTNSIHRFIFN